MHVARIAYKRNAFTRYVNFESTAKSCFILIVLADDNVSFSTRSLLHETRRCLQTVGVNGDNIKVAHK